MRSHYFCCSGSLSARLHSYTNEAGEWKPLLARPFFYSSLCALSLVRLCVCLLRAKRAIKFSLCVCVLPMKTLFVLQHFVVVRSIAFSLVCSTGTCLQSSFCSLWQLQQHQQQPDEQSSSMENFAFACQHQQRMRPSLSLLAFFLAAKETSSRLLLLQLKRRPANTAHGCCFRVCVCVCARASSKPHSPIAVRREKFADVGSSFAASLSRCFYTRASSTLTPTTTQTLNNKANKEFFARQTRFSTCKTLPFFHPTQHTHTHSHTQTNTRAKC